MISDILIFFFFFFTVFQTRKLVWPFQHWLHQCEKLFSGFTHDLQASDWEKNRSLNDISCL